MIRLTIELEDMDFDALIDRYLPVIGEQLRSSGNPLGALLSGGASASVAKGLLRALSRAQQEQLAAELINSNRARLTASLEQLAADQGFQARVTSLQAVQEERTYK